MKQLWIMGLIAACLFGSIYYQSFRDKRRWKRISDGMSLFGRREDIPPFVLDGVTYVPHERNVLLIWGDQTQIAYYTVADAKLTLERERGLGAARAAGARIFAWDGDSWKQRV